MFSSLDFLIGSLIKPGTLSQQSYTRNPFTLSPQPVQPTEDTIRSDSFAPPYSAPLDLDNYGRETDEMRNAYREFHRKEPSVRSAIEGVIASIADTDVAVMPEDDSRQIDCKAAEFIQWTVERSPHGWDGLIRRVGLAGMIDGWSVNEPTLQGTTSHNKWGGYWGLKHVKNKDTAHLRLQLDVHRNILGVVNNVRGLATYPTRKAIVFTHADVFDNPFGASELRAAYRACQMIENAYKLWSYALKANAGPFLKGTIKQAERRKAMERALAEARAGGWIVVPDGDTVDLVNLASATSFDAFERQIDKLREEIYMTIRGAYLPYMQGASSGGETRGDSEQSKSAGANPRERVLAKAIARCISLQLFPSLVVPNFGPMCGIPRLVIGGVDWKETKDQLDVADSVRNKFKLPISRKWLYSISQVPPPMGDDDALEPDPTPPPNQPSGGGLNFSGTRETSKGGAGSNPATFRR